MPVAPLPDHFEDGPLVIRRWRAEDAPAIVEAVTENREHLRPWMEWIAFEPQSVEQRVALIEQWEREWLGGGDVVLGIFVHDHPVGGTGLHRRIGPDGLEIGYWISEDHIGMGIATRATSTLTTGAFTIPGITHVEVHCDVANTASARVPERLGFTYTGDIEQPIKAPAETGAHRVYRMTRDAWAARENQP
jgi:ribosomal-protein-serine acetyltransferase